MDFAFAQEERIALDQAFSDYCQNEGISTDTCKDFLKNGNLFYLDNYLPRVEASIDLRGPLKMEYDTGFDWDSVIVD